MALSEQEIARYARQLLLPSLGEAGQERLKAARVRVIGSGRVAGPALLYLAEAGVGTLFVNDAASTSERDRAGWIHPPAAVGTPRVGWSIETARAANALIQVAAYRTVDAVTAALVATESPEERKELAEELRVRRVPHVIAEAEGEGGAVTVVPVGAPCFACASQEGFGIPSTAAGSAVVGALAAAELVLMITCGSQEPKGRRIELVRGLPSARATTRISGCACGREMA